MHKYIATIIVALATVATMCNAQTDIFGSDDTVKILSPASGAVYTEGAVVPIIVEMHDDWEISGIEIWYRAATDPGGQMKRLATLNSAPFETTLALDNKIFGQVTITAFATLSGENTGHHFQADASISVVPGTAPTSIEVMDRWQHVPSANLEYRGTRSLDVYATFADGTRRSVSEPGFGVTYTMLNEGIISIADDGEITPLSDGETLVRIDYMGLEDWAYVTVSDPAIVPPPFPAAQNINADISVHRSGFRVDPDSRVFAQNVSLTNASALPMPPFIKVILDGLPNDVAVVSDRAEKSVTLSPQNRPMFVPGGFPNDLFMPGDTISFDVQFSNPNGVPIDYDPIVYVSGKY